MLHSIIKDVLMNKCRINGDHEHTESCHECETEADDVTIAFLRSLPDIRRTLATDIQAAYEGDPAAIYTEEILLGYPSIEAVSIYRMAHKLFELGVPIIPRVMTEYAHQQTGIDIHPGATIGRHFFIDHGTGVVIGETCVIGDNVKLYQGVTLGAKSFEMDDAGMPVKGVKRHPNIENNVVIYSGATILGGDTTVGEGSIIGGNVWLVHSVPPHTRVYNSTPQSKHKHRRTISLSIKRDGAELNRAVFFIYAEVFILKHYICGFSSTPCSEHTRAIVCAASSSCSIE